MSSPRFDETDRKILAILQSDGRLPNARIAEQVGLSPPTVLERIRKLEDKGIITGYTVLVDAPRVGLNAVVFVSITLSLHRAESIEDFRKTVLGMPEVLECHHTTGDDDFLLKVVVPDIAHYEEFLLRKLTRVEGVSKVKSSFVLSTLKRDVRLPLPELP